MTPLAEPNRAEITERLQIARQELEALEAAFRREDIEVDARVLLEFRRAIDNVRQSAWTVQQWLDLKAKQRDVASLLSVSALARVRRASQMCNDLANEMESSKSFVDSGAVRDLYRAVDKLHDRLMGLFQESEEKP